MIHPDTELRFISPTVGYGMVATKLIPAGTITWVLDPLDREFTPQAIAALPPSYRDVLDKYCYRNRHGNFVLCWDNARYVNHSFNSSCVSTAYHFEIAVRDIAPGEELTDDYGYLNVTEPFRAIDEGHRRKVVYPDDLLRYSKHWDRKVLGAFKYVHAVNQPLREILPAGTWERVGRVCAGTEQFESIRATYYDARAARRRARADLRPYVMEPSLPVAVAAMPAMAG